MVEILIGKLDRLYQEEQRALRRERERKLLEQTGVEWLITLCNRGVLSVTPYAFLTEVAAGEERKIGRDTRREVGVVGVWDDCVEAYCTHIARMSNPGWFPEPDNKYWTLPLYTNTQNNPAPVLREDTDTSYPALHYAPTPSSNAHLCDITFFNGLEPSDALRLLTEALSYENNRSQASKTLLLDPRLRGVFSEALGQVEVPQFDLLVATFDDQEVRFIHGKTAPPDILD